MTRFGRIRRRPDHWTSPHERARVRAAERLDGPIGLAEATFLEGHLAECRDCAAVAAAYDADRTALRALRGADPEPPRDLWARTAAAIERESAARGRAAASRRQPSSRRVPLGALSGVAVIAVIVGATAVSTGLIPTFGSGAAGGAPNVMTTSDGSQEQASSQTDTAGGQASSGGRPGPTPFAVGAGDVAWLEDAAGALAYNTTPIDEVCPEGADCAVVGASRTQRLETLQAEPETIIKTPDSKQAVVVSRNVGEGQQLLVVDLPQDGDRQGPEPAETAEVITPTQEPSAASASAPPASAEPASPPPAASDAPAQSAAPSQDPTPVLSAAPTAAASLAIAADVTVVGESAAFSADGRYFAFSARSAATTGPDVYLWRVGSDRDAQPITADGLSTFASWAGGNLLVSRPANADLTAEASEGTPETLVIDPANGAVLDTVEAWRPAVDPTGARSIAWIGSIARADGDDQAWRPLDGSLELRAWPISGTAEEPSGRRERIASKALIDFDVRWDESGEWVAIWTVDSADAAFGRLSLYRVDPEKNALSQPKGAPKDVPALPGFSIGEGRLAWATPPGQGGEGSRVQVVAWNADGVGTVETRPADDIVIIR